MDEKWLIDAMVKTTETVFESMVFMKVKCDKFDQKIAIADKHLTAMVGFAGVYMGLAAIHCTISFARKICASMLSMDPAKLTDEDVRDALGEIANMVAGYFKARLAETLQTQDDVFEQSVPSIISGDDYETCAVTDAPSHTIECQYNGDIFYIELALKKT